MEYNNISLPNQMVGSKTKQTKSWQQNSVKYFLDTALYAQTERRRKTKAEMNRNWSVINSTLNDKELRDSFDPLGLSEEDEFSEGPIDFQFYNIVNNPIDTLLGEQLKRRADIRAIVVNPEAVNQKDKMFKEKLYGFLNTLSQQESPDPEASKQQLVAIDKWKKHDLQTAHEVMVNQILQIGLNDPNIDFKTKLNEAFRSLITNGEAILRVGNIGKEPRIYNVDGRHFDVIGIGESNKVEDGWAWIEYQYLNPYKILEEFNTKLTKTELKRLIEFFEAEAGVHLQYDYNTQSVSDGSKDVSSDQYMPLFGGNMLSMDEGSIDYIDKNGNILVIRVHFLSPRKVYEVTFPDETGTSQTRFEDEYYKPNVELGETTEELWVNEVWQGTRLAEDIYVDIKPCDAQMRSMMNPAIVRPPYVGIISSVGGQKAKGLLDDLIPYQKDFTIWMNKLNLLWVQNVGKVANVDMSLIPESFTMDEWFYWIKTFKINFQNKFNESDKGQLAGHMQQGARDIDLDISNEVMQAINTLEWLKQQIDQISGVSRQRQGEYAPREGLGTSQQAIVQSTHQTEPIYNMLDKLAVSTLEVFVENIKVLWKDDKRKRQYMLDDVSNYTIDVDGELLNEAEYGIQITNSGRLFELEQMLTQLSHAAMQNGTATLTDIARMRMSTSPSEMLISLEAAEDKRLKQQQEQQQAQIAAQKEQQQMVMQMEERKHQMELEKLQIEQQYKLQETMLKQEAEEQKRVSDTNSNWIDDEVEENMNIRDNKLKDKEIEANKALKEKELELKEKIEMAKIAAQKEIAKMKKTTN